MTDDPPRCTYIYDPRGYHDRCLSLAVTTHNGEPVCAAHLGRLRERERRTIALRIIADLPLEQLRAIEAAGGLAAITKGWRDWAGIKETP